MMEVKRGRHFSNDGEPVIPVIYKKLPYKLIDLFHRYSSESPLRLRRIQHILFNDPEYSMFAIVLVQYNDKACRNVIKRCIEGLVEEDIVERLDKLAVKNAIQYKLKDDYEL